MKNKNNVENVSKNGNAMNAYYDNVPPAATDDLWQQLNQDTLLVEVRKITDPIQEDVKTLNKENKQLKTDVKRSKKQITELERRVKVLEELVRSRRNL